MQGSDRDDTGRLNAKQEKFCVYMVDGNMSATAAYKAVYGQNLSDTSAAASASKLLKIHKIKNRIKELRDEAAAPKIKTIIEAKAALSQIIDDPEVATGTRVAAIKLLLQSSGALYRENATEVNLYTGTDTIIYLPELDRDEDFEEETGQK